MPATRQLRSKHWCITINNPAEGAVSLFDPNTMTYMILGKEKGEGGTVHLQGYIAFKNRQRFTAVSKVFPRAHLEVMRGTPQENKDYCSKDKDFIEHGTLPLTPAQGVTKCNKRKWDEAFALACKGDINKIEKGMLIRYYHAFKRIKQDNPEPLVDNPKTCGLWYTGPTGAGKSKQARIDFPDYFDKPMNKWWDGYRNQPNVILDDLDPFHGNWIGSHLKRWTDHYPFPAEQKGTTIMIRPKQIIVTTQYSIREVFHHDEKMIDALERRFTLNTFHDYDDWTHTATVGTSVTKPTLKRTQKRKFQVMIMPTPELQESEPLVTDLCQGSSDEEPTGYDGKVIYDTSDSDACDEDDWSHTTTKQDEEYTDLNEEDSDVEDHEAVNHSDFIYSTVLK